MYNMRMINQDLASQKPNFHQIKHGMITSYKLELKIFFLLHSRYIYLYIKDTL